jgi:hypothetical protein
VSPVTSPKTMVVSADFINQDFLEGNSNSSLHWKQNFKEFAYIFFTTICVKY